LRRRRFIADTQSFREPAGLRSAYEGLCKVPALVDGI